ncbi:MAG: thioredoxin family protein [Saprospiraceae bacterium]
MLNSAINKVLLLLFSLSLLKSGQLVGQGIQFKNPAISFEDIVSESRDSDTIIFVAVYSNSCENCVEMMEEVYPLESVGTVFNKKFINLKIDIDSDAGIAFAEKFPVRALPTYYFFDGKGNPIHWENGARPAIEFIEMGLQANDPEFQYFNLKSQFERGVSTPDQLKRLSFLAEDLGEYGLLERVHQAYLATQSNWLTPENMQIIFAGLISIEQETFQFLLQHLEAFNTSLGTQKLFAKIDQLMLNDVSMAAYDSEKKGFDLDKARKYAEAFLPESMVEKTMSLFQVNQLKVEGNIPAFINASIRHFDTYESYNPFLLNNIARTILENSTDKQQLLKGANLAEKAIQLENGWQCEETAALLYYKAGDIKNARMHAERALEIAKKSGGESSECLEILESSN